MIKRCTDKYSYGCTTEANLTNLIDLSSKFRLVKTKTGDYYRNVCRKCEAMKQKVHRKNVKGANVVVEPELTQPTKVESTTPVKSNPLSGWDY